MRMLLCVTVWLPLILSGSAYDLLVLTPFGSNSVRAVFSSLTETLLENGHRVTLVSSGDPVPRHDNLTHLLSPHTALDQLDLFKVRFGLSVFQVWKKAFPEAARDMYIDKKMMDLWRQRNEFDAIIINSAANEMAFPFLMDTKVPFITLQPAGIDPLQLSYLGNMISPAVLPSIVLPYDNHMTLWERTVNTLVLLVLKHSYKRSVAGPLREALKPFFPELPEPRDVYPLQSLALFNSHPLIDGAVPLLPTQVEVGCLSCRPSNTIQNKEILAFVEGAGEAGAVLFSLGSFQQSNRIPEAYQKALLEGFAKLQHIRFVAMLPTDREDIPPNVMAVDWLPQQDILGHPAIRLFISHCGRQSASQALYHGVPILGLPIAFDQPRMGRRLAKRGQAVLLQWEDLTPQLIEDTVLHMLNNGSYTEMAQLVAEGLAAQRETGMDHAVWAIEQTVKGRQHGLLRYAGEDLSMAQYMLLDVLCVLGLALGLLLALLGGILWALFRVCGGAVKKLKEQ